MNKRHSGAIASYAYTVAQMVIALLYVPLLLRGIGQSEYGLYQFIGSIMAYLMAVSSTLAAGVTRFYCKYYAEGDEDGMANTLAIATRAVRWLGVASLVVGVACMFAVRAVYAESFTAWELDESCVLLGILVLNFIVSMSNTISVAVISAHEEFVFLKMTCLATLVAQPIVVLVCMQWYPYAITVCAAQLVCNFGQRTIQHMYARKRLGMDTKLRFLDEQLQSDLLKFSAGIVMGIIADEIFWRTDQLILGYLFGTGVVAVYAVGSQICMTYMYLGTTISSVFMYRISSLMNAENPLRELSELFAKVGRIACYPLMLVLSGFVIFGQDFIRLWAGEGFGEAYWVALVIMVPFTVDIMQNVGFLILQVMNKHYFRARMYLVAAVANVALTILFAVQYGMIGAAVATGVTMIVTSGIVMNVYYAKGIGLDMGLYWRQTLRFMVPVLPLCAAGVFAWNAIAASVQVGWLVLIAGILGYTAVYAAVVLLLSSNEYERGLIRSLLSKIRRGV